MSSITNIGDLQVSLKLEKKDHEFTKNQLDEMEKSFEDFKDT